MINESEPRMGPINGGTTITITGNFLNSGRDIRAYTGFSECQLV